MKTKSILAAMLLLASATVMAEDQKYLTISYSTDLEHSIELPIVQKITFQDGNVVVTTSEGVHSYPISILNKMTFTTKDIETAITTLPEQSEGLTYADGQLSIKGNGLLRVYNTSGAMVSVVNVEEGANVNLNQFPAGIYIIRMGEQAIKVKK